MSLRHIIFDCDGVLIDSEDISMVIDQRLLAQNGAELSLPEMYRRFVGKTFAAMVQEIEDEFGLTLPADLELRKDGLMLAEYRKSLKPIDHIAVALDEIDLPKSIGTNGPRARALEALKMVGIDHHFGSRITTFEDVQNGKPAPDVYLLAAGRAGFTPAECAVVEDSVTGMLAAARAGCKTFGYTGSHAHDPHHADRLKHAGAQVTFNDMRQLPGLIRSAL